MKGRYLVGIAVAVFLVFMGMTGYQFLCPLGWSVTCVIKGSFGTETSTVFADRQDGAKKFADDAAKLGQTCTTVTVVRRCLWHRSF
jgi:hypothetical protein